MARGQSAPKAKGSCSLWDASQPTSFAAREETHHQVRVGVCMVGAGQGGLLAVSCPKPENEICLRTRERWKTSEFNSKHLEKEGRKKCFCLHQGQTSGSHLPCSLQLRVSCINPRQPLRGSTWDGGDAIQIPLGDISWGASPGQGSWMAGQPRPSEEKVLLHKTLTGASEA